MLKPIISKDRTTSLIVLAGIIILLFAAWSWFRMVYSRPSVVFDRMINTMLSTPGLSKTALTGDDHQGANQNTQLTAVPQQRVHAVSVSRQASNEGAANGTVISTESIGTVSADFERYNDITTTEKSSSGKDFNFQSVLGVWGKAAANDPTSGGAAQLFNKTALGVIPIGNLSAGQRSQLVKQLKKEGVYTVDFTKVKKQLVAGRPVYSYEVTMSPAPYISMLKTFARDTGIVELEKVDPSEYQDLEPLQFTFDIDVWSGQLRKITYTASQQIETYGSYGALLNIVPPNTYISKSELQSRLQQIQ